MVNRVDAIRIQREQDLLMQSVESGYERDIYNEKNRYLKEVIQYYIRTKLVNNDLLLIEHETNMVEIAQKHTLKTISKFSRYHYNNLTKSHALDIHYKKIEASLYDMWLKQWMSKHGGKRIRNASKTTKQDIQQALTTSTRLQEQPNDIIKRLQSVAVLNRYRADVISRTETHAAAMFASMNTSYVIESETDLKLLKYWLATEDDRTRDAHLDMDPDNGIPLNEQFNVGGESMDAPGDPNADPSNTINCRCCLTYSN